MVDMFREGTFYVTMEDTSLRLLASKLLYPNKKRAFGFKIGSEKYYFADKYITATVQIHNKYIMIVTELSNGKIMRLETTANEDDDIVSIFIMDPSPNNG